MLDAMYGFYEIHVIKEVLTKWTTIFADFLQ